MTRNVARKLRNGYKEPRTFKKIVRHVGLMARCGFDDTTIVFEHKDRSKVMDLQVQLLDKGFCAEMFTNPECIHLVVEW